jgi:hypothetical protein
MSFIRYVWVYDLCTNVYVCSYVICNPNDENENKHKNRELDNMQQP